MTRLASALLLALLLPIAARSAAAQVVRRNVAKLVFDSGVIVIDAHGDATVVVGAAAGDGKDVLSVSARQAREWADSAGAILARRVPSSKMPRAYRALLVDRASGAGMSITRHVLRGRSTYRLFFADTAYGGFPMALSRREASLLARAMRRAAAEAARLARPPRPRVHAPRRRAAPRAADTTAH